MKSCFTRFVFLLHKIENEPRRGGMPWQGRFLGENLELFAPTKHDGLTLVIVLLTIASRNQTIVLC